MGSWKADKKLISPDLYMDCLHTFLNSIEGRGFQSSILMSSNGVEIIGFRQTITAVFIDSAAIEGVQLLQDIRNITDSGPANTFSFSQEYYNYESYVVFMRETIINVALALLAVGIMVLIVTANLIVTLLVLLSVSLVDFFLFGMLALDGVSINSVTIVNIVIAIGLAVDYSAHIAHGYLEADPPKVDKEGNTLNNH